MTLSSTTISHRRGVTSTLAVAALPIAMVAAVQPSKAANLDQLKSKGFKVGKLTKNRAGLPGWYVNQGSTKYFCKLDTRLKAVKNSRTLMSFTTTGRQILLDLKAMEDHSGRKVDTSKLPKLSNLNAGRINRNDTRGCVPSS